MMPMRLSPVEMVERLVGFDTVSSNSNLALIEFAEDFLTTHGARTRRSSGSKDAKANLLASFGPEREGGIVLSGHTDVVPVEGQPWDSDPFRLREEGGRLYGRGTADMKSFLATALALAPDIAAARLERPIHLALSYDEEVGCFGVSSLIEDMLRNLPRPRAVIIGEPTEMRLVNAHKGVSVFRTQIRGREVHSSLPQLGANAILAAGELIHLIGDMAREKREQALPESPFAPPYTTFNVGLLKGGTAANIVPLDCSFVWEFRPLPGDDAAAIFQRFDSHVTAHVLPKLRETAPEAQIETEQIAEVPALTPESDSPAEELVRHLTGQNRASTIAIATEGGLFQAAGLSTVICGPGSIEQAHKPNEYIEIEQIEACEAFLRRLLAWACEAA
jgi:acetylornithine deacetylase